MTVESSCKFDIADTAELTSHSPLTEPQEMLLIVVVKSQIIRFTLTPDLKTRHTFIMANSKSFSYQQLTDS